MPEQATHLMERQVRLNNGRSLAYEKRKQSGERHKSQFSGVDADSDFEARKLLSKFAYEKLFTVEMRKRTHWRVISRAPGNVVVVGEVDGPTERTTDPHKRCNCECNVKYGIQCVHELVGGGCDLSKYDDRWFCNTRSFLS